MLNNFSANTSKLPVNAFFHGGARSFQAGKLGNSSLRIPGDIANTFKEGPQPLVYV